MNAPTISDIVERIRTYSADADIQPVMTAYLLAARVHAGQTRKSGEPYLTHPLAVALILAELKMDVETIATALLHDALEDNPITLDEMEAQVGPLIAGLVDGVTKIGKLKFRSREELAAENFRKMMLAMSRDLRVILVKLADRLHNMRTIEHHTKEKCAEIANETLEIYVPIANRLGLTRVKDKLEDLCVQTLHPEQYNGIVAYLAGTQADRERYTERVCAELREHLRENGIAAKVRGRAKHPASIWRKMVRQDLAVAQIPDLLAFRVIVEDVGACYAALGLIHATFPPVPDRIKDYIARPKANGYQSLHTTVVGSEERRVEIQIRTEGMDRIAQEGIAAHWTYKEGHLALAPEEVIQITKIRDLFDAAGEAEDATEFMEAVKVEFYADEVFVFTPKGDVKRFPQGSTTLDFAYAIHTDVGNRCTGARVNGRMVPLRYELHSGDTVEILTAEHQRPTRDWLDIARTGRAIQKIRRVLRQEERDQGEKLGRDMVEAELQRFGWTLARVMKEGRGGKVLKERGIKELDALLVEVARGHQPLVALVRDLLPEGVYQTHQEQAQQSALQSLISRFRRSTTSPVLITGEDGVLVNYAKCCGPLPGEPIVGFITRGRGITVHRASCPQLADLDPERRIPVEWDAKSETRHAGEIHVYCTDRPGMLANITKICEQNGVNINRVEATNAGEHPAVVTLQLSLRDVNELTRLIKHIEKVPGVETVQRTAG